MVVGPVVGHLLAISVARLLVANLVDGVVLDGAEQKIFTVARGDTGTCRERQVSRWDHHHGRSNIPAVY